MKPKALVRTFSAEIGVTERLFDASEPHDRWMWEKRDLTHRLIARTMETKSPGAIRSHYLENIDDYDAIATLIGAQRISQLDRTSERNDLIEPLLLGIDRMVHPLWPRLSPREVCGMLFVYALYERRPRRSVLSRAQFNLERLALKSTTDSVRMWMPPMDNGAHRRTAFCRLSLDPFGSNIWDDAQYETNMSSWNEQGAPVEETQDIPNAAWTLGCWGIRSPTAWKHLAKAALVEDRYLRWSSDALLRLLWGAVRCGEWHRSLAGKISETLHERGGLSVSQQTLAAWCFATMRALDLDEKYALKEEDVFWRQALASAPTSKGIRQQQSQILAQVKTQENIVLADPSVAHEPQEVEKNRKLDDPMTKAFTILSKALAQACPIPPKTSYSPLPNIRIPIAWPEQKIALDLADTPFHRIPHGPWRRVRGQEKPGDALARGEWIGPQERKWLQDNQYTIIPVSWPQFAASNSQQRRKILRDATTIVRARSY